jgi:hypothetical protein
MPTRDGPPSSRASGRREELQSEAAKEEKNLRRLEAEQAEAKARLSALRLALAALDVAAPPCASQPCRSPTVHARPPTR